MVPAEGDSPQRRYGTARRHHATRARRRQPAPLGRRDRTNAGSASGFSCGAVGDA